MCGICGIWNDRGVSEAELRAMAGKIRHRGPDDEGLYVGPQFGMASRRLSIIDIDYGRQPIENEDGTIHIVFNGEIYNFETLRKQLLGQGHRFRTHTDTEVILHLYEQVGLKCVDKLNGMFAFAIWDARKRRLFIARDPLGQKPLYYAFTNGSFVFASEIKSLLQCSDIVPRMDFAAVHDCLSLRCVPGDATLFKGIKKLPAGHHLLLENGKVQVERHWDLQYLPKAEGTEEEMTEHLLSLLKDTVQSHLVSHAPVGAFLSGGIDSSLIVAIMAEFMDQPVKTFSIGIRETSFNELPFARRLAEHCRTDHHESMVRPDLISTLPDMIYHMEEPVDPFAFGVYSASELAAGHVKVVLGGDGGDEMFVGYDRYLGNYLVDIYCALHGLVRSRVIEPLIDRLPDSYRYNNRVQKLRWLPAMSRSSGGRRYAESACFLRFNHERKQSLYTDACWRDLRNNDSADHLLQFFEAENASNVIDRMLYTDVKTRLAEHLLMVGDRMTMAHGIEARSPLVDRYLAEFVATLPSRMKIRGRSLKYILRQVGRDLIPDALIQRKKQGFSFPLGFWFKNELRDTTANLLQNGNMVEEGYFRPQAMLEMLDEHASGKMDHNYRLWLLLNLELWHRLYIEGQPKYEVEELLRSSLSSRHGVLQ